MVMVSPLSVCFILSFFPIFIPVRQRVMARARSLPSSEHPVQMCNLPEILAHRLPLTKDQLHFDQKILVLSQILLVKLQEVLALQYLHAVFLQNPLESPKFYQILIPVLYLITGVLRSNSFLEVEPILQPETSILPAEVQGLKPHGVVLVAMHIVSPFLLSKCPHFLYNGAAIGNSQNHIPPFQQILESILQCFPHLFLAAKQIMQ